MVQTLYGSVRLKELRKLYSNRYIHHSCHQSVSGVILARLPYEAERPGANPGRPTIQKCNA